MHTHSSYITLYHRMAYISAILMCMPASARHKGHFTAEIPRLPHDWTGARSPWSTSTNIVQEVFCSDASSDFTPKNHRGSFFVRKTDNDREANMLCSIVPLSHCIVVTWHSNKFSGFAESNVL
jgi:hypothetical protein